MIRCALKVSGSSYIVAPFGFSHSALWCSVMSLLFITTISTQLAWCNLYTFTFATHNSCNSCNSTQCTQLSIIYVLNSYIFVRKVLPLSMRGGTLEGEKCGKKILIGAVHFLSPPNNLRFYLNFFPLVLLSREEHIDLVCFAAMDYGGEITRTNTNTNPYGSWTEKHMYINILSLNTYRVNLSQSTKWQYPF